MKATPIVRIITKYSGYTGLSMPQSASPYAHSAFPLQETRGFISLPPTKITSPYYEAMAELARTDVVKLHQTIKFSNDFSNLSVEERYELAKIAAAQDGGETTCSIQEYGLTDQSQLYEVAKIAAAQDGEGTSTSIQEYELTDQSQLYAVAKIAVLSDINSFPFIADYLLGLDSFETTKPDLDSDKFRTDKEFGREEFTVYAGGQLAKLGLDQTLADCLYGDMQNRDAGMKLFLLLVEAAKKGELANVPEPRTTNLTRYLLAKHIGLDPVMLYGKKYSRNDISSFYLLCLSLQNGMPHRIFEKTIISPELFKEKNQKKLITFLRSLERVENIMGGGASRQFMELMSCLEAITPPNVGALTREVDDLFMRLFKKMFKISGENITMEKIKALEERWGDLDVFYTLAARFNSKSDWRKELPVLSRIVEHVLEGTFDQLKYQGDPADQKDQELAAAQLSMLKEDEAAKGWRGNYARISVFKTGQRDGAVTEDALLARSKNLLSGQVISHIAELTKENQQGRIEIEALKTKIRQVPKYESIKKEDPAAALIACVELLEEAEDIKTYRAVLNLLNSARSYFRLNAQIEADLKSLADLLKYKETGSEAIVFTTTTDDPKLLLMTGALVDASSCQDYRHGSHVQTLPGYVIDAGVKLVLSYALRERDFASLEEYVEAKRLIDAGISPEFIPAKQIIKIGGIEIQLPKAIIRRVIKLGRMEDGGAGIFVERPYSQNHYAEAEMGKQIESIVEEIALITGAQRKGKITFPFSRNPGGIYSDATGGTQNGEYSVAGLTSSD